MSFWRKLNLVFFYISLVAFIIAYLVLVIFILSKDHLRSLAIMVIPGGLILIPVIFSGWGILLEFLTNVGDIRDKVCDGTVVVEQNGGKTSSLLERMGVNTQSAVAQPVQNNTGSWVCPACNCANNSNDVFCSNCGRNK